MAPRLSRRQAFGAAAALMAGLAVDPVSAQQRVRSTKRQVPATWEATYQELATPIRSLQATVDAAWNGSDLANTKFGSALSAANSSRYTQLITGGNANATTLAGAKLQAAQLFTAGLRSIQVACSWPILDANFHAVSGYEEFYFSASNPQGIIPYLKSLGFNVTIECNTIFRNVNSAFGTYYDTLNLATGISRKTDQCKRILELGGSNVDRLGCGSEPTNEASTLNKAEFLTPSTCATQWGSILSGVKATYPSSQLSLGIGTWESNATSYVDEFCALSDLNHMDLHVYPVVSGYMAAFRTLAQRVNTNFPTKGLVANQVWCYKVGASELGGSIDQAVEFLVRDDWDFWEPLDRDFLGLIADITREQRFTFVSAFESPTFALYLPYWSMQPLSAATQEVVAGIVQGNAAAIPIYSKLAADWAAGRI